VDDQTHEQFMQLALEQARYAESQGEVPVGAVLVKDNTIIAKGYNQPILSCDPTAHAEIIALREGANVLNNYRLLDTTLYVTLEPCVMCIGAILHARVGMLVYAATDPKAGAIESVFKVADAPQLNHRIDCVSGVLAKESSQLLTNFFRKRRAQSK
jgi:tRNA(adenine34) deaminase